MCTFVYLFVVYFSFAPVISASIHRYGNYFDIQVLMMVTETKTFNVDFTSYYHIYIYIYIYHHHVVPLARISLTLSRHFSLSFIASGRSSGLHPVSSHSCCMYVRAGRPVFARPYGEYITYELGPASPAVSLKAKLNTSPGPGCKFCDLTLRIVSSIGELLLLIYKSGFNR